MTLSKTQTRGQRYDAEDLISLGKNLLIAAGMPADKATDIADIVVEGELMGKFTHGFSLLPRYVREIENGDMTCDGGPIVLNDFGACLAWDARKLPGPWIVLRAMDEGIARAKKFGMGAVTFQRSHHLACLGAFLRRATDQGYMMMLTLTDAGHSGVAPFGGITPVLTSNPIAFGAPTDGDPILVDMTTCLQSNGMAALYRERGERFPRPDLLDNQGRPTNDPQVIVTDPPGSILPLGGIHDGHKGYSIGLMVELLTGCLSGRGRAEPYEGWSAAAFLLIIDPEAFGGREQYLRQVEYLANACHASVPRPGFDRVLLPGEGALERRARQMRDGIEVSDALADELRAQAEKYKVSFPAELRSGRE